MSEQTNVVVETHAGGTQYTTRGNAAVADAPEGDVMASVRSPNGGKLNGPLSDECRITVGGIEVSVAQGKQHGLIRENDDGTLTELQQEPRQEQSDEGGSTEGLEVDSSTVETLSDWASSIREYTGSGAATVAMVGEMLEHGPSHTPAVLKELATHHGVGLSDVQSTLRNVVQDIDAAITSQIAAGGVSPEEFFEANRSSPEFLAAVNDAVFAQNLGSLRALVHKYKVGSVSGNAQTVKVNVGGRTITTDRATAMARGWQIVG